MCSNCLRSLKYTPCCTTMGQSQIRVSSLHVGPHPESILISHHQPPHVNYTYMSQYSNSPRGVKIQPVLRREFPGSEKDPHSAREIRRNVERFRGRLVSKAHRLLYRLTLGSRAMEKKRERGSRLGREVGVLEAHEPDTRPHPESITPYITPYIESTTPFTTPYIEGITPYIESISQNTTPCNTYHTICRVYHTIHRLSSGERHAPGT